MFNFLHTHDVDPTVLGGGGVGGVACGMGC